MDVHSNDTYNGDLNDDVLVDVDPQETAEWLDALQAVINTEGTNRAHYLLDRLIDLSRRNGANLPFSANTAYVNTIPVSRQQRMPGDSALEHRLRAYIRWNAMAMVVRANKESSELGGHIASFQSAATLYEVGFHHFFRGPNAENGADLLFFQGHSAPGIYARAFLEGRISEEQLVGFRREADGDGLSSYPHPWLMPDFWQFPTVSMGLGAAMSIYQARFMKYLTHRGITDTTGRHVWTFLGDGEMDEPESTGLLSLAAREKLDNLIFVVNCNLQRLDGPVRGNGKIIQELEATFRGAGWHVIKVIWGSHWDKLFARDKDGLLIKRMEEAVDGDYQAFKARGGAYIREYFFGKYQELAEMVADLTDDDIYQLNRGGHDPRKVYAAYYEATQHRGKPVVILAKTVKGYGMGQEGEGKNTTHQQKKLHEDTLYQFRDRFNLPLSDAQVAQLAFVKPAENSAEMRYLHERRQALGGYLPTRTDKASPLTIPSLDAFAAVLKGSEREISTTMAFVRCLTTVTKDKTIGKYVVPIVPDEARTFGMEGLFRQLGIYSSSGQLYEPEDSDKVMWYREDINGQILQEGINECGAFAEWLAAATAYATHGVNMIPMYIFYSMFGFQRIGDLAWAAGDMQARGFLLGATSGRTTLSGEGLQHQDGHSHLFAGAIPNCVAYDPAFAYEVAVIMHAGLERMYAKQENVFYYLTVLNENTPQPPMPDGAEAGIIRGIHRVRDADKRIKLRVRLLGSGAILHEALHAADMLRDEWQVSADVFSVTSFTELARDGNDIVRNTRLRVDGKRGDEPFVTTTLRTGEGPIVAATDYVRHHAEQIRAFVEDDYHVLGTDGFGRSDTRAALRRFFEVDRYAITCAALYALSKQGKVTAATVKKAMKQYGIDADRRNPRLV